MHDYDKFNIIALRLSEQVGHLTQLVSKLQISINQLQVDNQDLRASIDFKTLARIPWDQAAVTTLIHPSPIKLFSSSPIQDDFNMFDGEIINEFDPINLVSTESSSILAYYDTFSAISQITEEPTTTAINTMIPLTSSLSPPTPSSATRRKITRKSSGPLKILIVEDDPLCQQLISHIIKSLHIGQCEVVADGVEAVINMSTNSFDLILMDMQLPHLDGLQATQNIRKFNRRTPIISMTARLGEDDIKRYFEGGIDDILPKPFDKQSVRRIIEQFFKLSIAEDKQIDDR
jgi:CheY-like chemotaxis protein